MISLVVVSRWYNNKKLKLKVTKLQISHSRGDLRPSLARSAPDSPTSIRGWVFDRKFRVLRIDNRIYNEFYNMGKIGSLVNSTFEPDWDAVMGTIPSKYGMLNEETNLDRVYRAGGGATLVPWMRPLMNVAAGCGAWHWHWRRVMIPPWLPSTYSRLG